MVHWLGLVDFTAMALSSILGQVTKILQAMQFSQTTTKKNPQKPHNKPGLHTINTERFLPGESKKRLEGTALQCEQWVAELLMVLFSKILFSKQMLLL